MNLERYNETRSFHTHEKPTQGQGIVYSHNHANPRLSYMPEMAMPTTCESFK